MLRDFSAYVTRILLSCHCEAAGRGTEGNACGAISWYDVSICYAENDIVPGGSHGLSALGMTAFSKVFCNCEIIL